MAEWSEAQVSEWISLIDLPDGCAEAVQGLFAEDVDGEDLVDLKPKALRKMLRMAGIPEPEPVVETILRQRDSASGPSDAAAATECPLCMEPYAEDDSGKHVPRILQCGHSACHDCYARMLRPIVAKGDFKELECPECRVVTNVLRGKADNLQKNFALLR